MPRKIFVPKMEKVSVQFRTLIYFYFIGRPIDNIKIYPGVKLGRSVTLTIHLHLVSRPRMSRSYTSPHWRLLCGSGADLFYFALNMIFDFVNF
jgi:hypothetical protein